MSHGQIVIGVIINGFERSSNKPGELCRWLRLHLHYLHTTFFRSTRKCDYIDATSQKQLLPSRNQLLRIACVDVFYHVYRNHS